MIEMVTKHLKVGSKMNVDKSRKVRKHNSSLTNKAKAKIGKD